MRTWLLTVLTSWVFLVGAMPSGGETVGQVFDRVNGAVVVIRARGHDAPDAGSGLAHFSETGSGVVISADGKVMTAAHVVQAMDEINVESIGGEVIGIVSHNISKSGGSEGLGFVVSINTAKQFLLEKRSFWSGMEGELVSGRLGELFNVPQPVGFLVTVVAKDSPSALAGLRGGDMKATVGTQAYTVGGDIILKIDGITIAGVKDMVTIRERLGGLPSGRTYTLTVLRGGKILDLTARVP